MARPPDHPRPTLVDTAAPRQRKVSACLISAFERVVPCLAFADHLGLNVSLSFGVVRPYSFVLAISAAADRRRSVILSRFSRIAHSIDAHSSPRRTIMLTFKVKDLLIHVPIKAGGGGGGSVGMPNPDCDGTSVPPILTPHTPVLQVANLTPQFDAAKSAVRRAFGENDRDGPAAISIAQAVEARNGTGSPALAVALDSAYTAVAGGIIQAATSRGGGGGTSLPGPDDETPPSPISPIAHRANLVLRGEHLAFIKTQLTATLRAVEEAEVALTPRSVEDIAAVTKALQGALTDLQGGANLPTGKPTQADVEVR
jgi:hypothetical protein